MPIGALSNRLLEACVFGQSRHWEFDFCLSLPPPDQRRRGRNLVYSHLEGGPYDQRHRAFSELVSQLADHLAIINPPTRTFGAIFRATQLGERWLRFNQATGNYEYDVRLDACGVIRGKSRGGGQDDCRALGEEFLVKLAMYLEEQQWLPPFPDPKPWWVMENHERLQAMADYERDNPRKVKPVAPKTLKDPLALSRPLEPEDDGEGEEGPMPSDDEISS